MGRSFFRLSCRVVVINCWTGNQEAGRKKEGKFWNAVDMIFKNLTANLTDAPRREK